MNTRLSAFADHFVENWPEPFIVAAAISWDMVGGNDPEVQMTAALWLYRLATLAN